jgi:hypothetical protein
VTIETFEDMVAEIPNFDLARLLDAYNDHVQAMEAAWQVMPLEKQEQTPMIMSASAIAVWADNAYIADSTQHAIFRVTLSTDDIQCFCGIRGRMGLHDGPREVAKFKSPGGLAFCEGKNVLYVCDTGNHAIRYVSLPSGVVGTLSLTHMDSELRLESPVGITIVRGEYEYQLPVEDDEEEGEEDMEKDRASDFGEDDENDEDDKDERHAHLEGISEEDEQDTESYKSFSQSAGDVRLGTHVIRNPSARHALSVGDKDGGPEKGFAAGRLSKLRRFSRGQSNLSDYSYSRRTSNALSASMATSRRTSTFLSSVITSRRTSTQPTPGESVKDSLKECTEEEEEVGYNLAVTGDHCVYLVQPEKKEFIVLAGNPSEYGYKDAEKGLDARFSSLKGIIGIRHSLFLADHWNNVIRCVNLKTRQVDTVIDFNPCGPISLAVSSSGSVYVLDSEHVSVCNILKICSLQCVQGDEEALGTTMFKMIQESIGRSRSVLSNSSSQRGSLNEQALLESMSRRGSFRRDSRGGSRKNSFDSEVSDMASEIGGSRYNSRRNSVEGSRRNSAEAYRRNSYDGGSRRNSAQKHKGRRTSDRQRAGSIADLGQRLDPGMSHSRRGSSMSQSLHRGQGHILPEVPRALRSLVPGASLHPALIQMTARSQNEKRKPSNAGSAMAGSQFRVSVVSSVPEEDLDDAPEFVSFMNPKNESPWRQIPIGTLPYVYQQATGQCTANTPLALAYWDAADNDSTAASGLRNPQQLLVGSAEWPSIVKVLPPRKGAPQDAGRFRAVAVDIDRVVMADTDSHQIFVVNHTKRSKHKIAGCGKAGYLDGPLDVCRMNHPSSIALDPTTHYIYVADSGNHRIRCIDLSTGFMSTVCGNGIKGNRDSNELSHQSLDSPFNVHFMHPCHLLISCADNSVRRLDLQMKQLETVLVGS